MFLVLTIIHIIACIGLIALVLLQTSEGGLGSAFGGGEIYHTKRGIEKLFFIMTIVLALVFTATSIGNVFLG
jgi:preprotein translocase subunit SecG